MLAAHLDTVPPVAPIEVTLVDGHLTNRNAAILGGDDKAAVAALIVADAARARRGHPARRRGAAHDPVRGDRAARGGPLRPGGAPRPDGLRLRPHRGARRHRGRRALAPAARGHVRRPPGPRRDRPRGRAERDPGGGPRRRPDAARPHRPGDHGQRRHRRRGHGHERGGRALHAHRRVPQPQRARAGRAADGDARRAHLGGERGRGGPGDAGAGGVHRLPAHRARPPGRVGHARAERLRLRPPPAPHRRRVGRQRLPAQRLPGGQPLQRHDRHPHLRGARRGRQPRAAWSTSRSPCSRGRARRRRRASQEWTGRCARLARPGRTSMLGRF